jgi:hypothetical protein
MFQSWSLLQESPEASYNRSSQATFISADGLSYRLTITANRTYNEDGEWFDGPAEATSTVIVTPADPGKFSFSEYLPDADTWRVSKVERVSGGTYEEISLPAGYADAKPSLVNPLPLPGVLVLLVMKTRIGYRWGWPALDGSPDVSDHDAKPYYRTRRLEVNLNASSSTTPAPAPTPEDPTPAAAPTAPGRSPYAEKPEPTPLAAGSALVPGGGFISGGGASGGW